MGEGMGFRERARRHSCGVGIFLAAGVTISCGRNGHRDTGPGAAATEDSAADSANPTRPVVSDVSSGDASGGPPTDSGLPCIAAR